MHSKQARGCTHTLVSPRFVANSAYFLVARLEPDKLSPFARFVRTNSCADRREGAGSGQLRECADARPVDFVRAGGPLAALGLSYSWRMVLSGWFEDKMEIPFNLAPCQVDQLHLLGSSGMRTKVLCGNGAVFNGFVAALADT